MIRILWLITLTGISAVGIRINLHRGFKHSYIGNDKVLPTQRDETKINQISHKRTNVYITIDDGPSAASLYLNNTAIADSINMTMFIIGNKILESHSNRILFNLYLSNPFIQTGNHSFSHANGHYQLYYKRPNEVIIDFEKNAGSFHVSKKIARLPGRNTWRINEKRRTDLADADSSADRLLLQGYRVFGWDIEWKNKQGSSHDITDAESVMKEIGYMAGKRNSFTPHNIVLLCHESMFVDSINRIQFDQFISIMKRDQRYCFKLLADYPGTLNHRLN